MLSDSYGLDSHKLHLHPERVSQWLRGEDIAPILVEICPIGRCNHRCVFCAYNYTDYKGEALEYNATISLLSDLGKMGVKAIDWDTEGEPLLHPHLPGFINHAKSCGIDSAVETNGVLLTEDFMRKCGHNITYIKVSVDAACNETHYKLHRGGEKDWEKVIKNVEKAVKLNTGCVIGIQAVLFRENEDEIRDLARVAKEIGVDWFAVKPFSAHPFQDKSLVHIGNVNKILDIPGVIVRKETFDRLEERDYPFCYGINFLSNIDCYGNVTICNTLTRKNEYVLGNIYEGPFEKIWKRRPQRIDMYDCSRAVCRMDKQNLYLWQLVKSDKHRNFI